MSDKLIFLDMDGVLCDFVSAAYSVHGRVFNAEEYPRGLFKLEDHFGITANQFWNRIDICGEHFWEHLEPYPWAVELVSLLSQHGKVIISTSPSKSPHSYSGKRRWLYRMGFHSIDSMFGKSKHLMARPGRILVDDGEHNTGPWELEGGRAILIPQPWNHADPVDDVISFVSDQLVA